VWWSSLQGYLYRNDGFIKKIKGSIVDGCFTEFGVALLLKQSLLLLTPDGEVVDHLMSEALPMEGPLKSLKSSGSHFYMESQDGWWSSADIFEWASSKAPDLIHQKPTVSTTLPLDLAQGIVDHKVSHSIPLERFLLDLHSGRVLGSFGPTLMEWSAWGLIFLTLSGVWVFTIKFSKGHHHRRRMRLKIKQKLQTKPLYQKK
jgi:hypothetical protein